MVGYDRRAALAERAIIPIRFGALDGEAEWLMDGERCAVASFADAGDQLRPMLFTALRTGYAEDRPAARVRRLPRSIAPGAGGAGPGAEQAGARASASSWSWHPTRPPPAATRPSCAAGWAARQPRPAWRWRSRTSATRSSGSPASGCGPSPSVLVTVGMAYEGMDAPEISHVACLTQIRSVPWLEQMVARATRFDPLGGDYEEQRAVIYHPDDPLFRRFRRAIEADQSGRARGPRSEPEQEELPLDDEPDAGAAGRLAAAAAALGGHRAALRDRAARAGDRPDRRGAAGARPAGLPETPSQAEQRLRRQVGQMVAAQVVEDVEAGLVGRPWGYHAYNAVLKRRVRQGRGRT